jgi:NAD(P)-dependent dehydrogenase (short-subunit alcohol dehydrogenase family)
MTDTKIWFLTGSSSGFGRSLAVHILAAGHRLIATARNPAQLADLVEQYPNTCRTMALDITNAEQVKDVIQKAAQAWGRLDVVVNNAGYGLVGALEEYDDAQIERNFDTNFFGPLRVMRAALPILRSQKSGHIINLSAIAGFSNELGFSIYGAAKFALEGASESLAGEVRHLGIKVTLILPGPFRTDFINRSLDRASTQISDYDPSSGKFVKFLASIDGKQPGDPGKAAEAIILIASEPNPPLRLVLGKYANDKIRRKLTSVEGELKAWESIALPTDF